MKILKVIKLIFLTLFLSLALFGSWVFYLVPATGLKSETIIWAEPKLAQIYVYGENAHFDFMDGFGQNVQILKDNERVYSNDPQFINKGLYMPSLSAGTYSIYAADLRVKAADDFYLDGYTITRNSSNLYYKFYNENGYLRLSVEQVSELPDDVYDIIINPGHGGNESGAVAGDYLEKNENLMAGIYMAELFSEYGLKVALTRDGDYFPGQIDVPSGDITPYALHGEVDLIYLSQAKYCLSSHLNGSPDGTWRGYQLYNSVRADSDWQYAIAAEYDAMGHIANDVLDGFGDMGIYKRYSQDDPATGRDYYYILREVGGIATTPIGYAEALPERDLRKGAESILLEHLFLNSDADRAYWDANWQGLVEAVVIGSLNYWGV